MCSPPLGHTRSMFRSQPHSLLLVDTRKCFILVDFRRKCSCLDMVAQAFRTTSPLILLTGALSSPKPKESESPRFSWFFLHGLGPRPFLGHNLTPYYAYISVPCSIYLIHCLLLSGLDSSWFWLTGFLLVLAYWLISLFLASKAASTLHRSDGAKKVACSL